MSRSHPALVAAVAVLSIALTNCSGGSSSPRGPANAGCSTSMDCAAPTPVCDPTLRACVQCAQDSDCASAERRCQANSCVARPNLPECQTNADCASKPLKYCSADQKCEWQCTGADATSAGCAAGEKCQDHVCVVADVCTQCTSTQYCFNHERCLGTPKPCTSNAACSATELCVQTGESEKTCQVKCYLSQNKTGGKNDGCWRGWGICQPADSGGQLGACVPPAQKTNAVGEACLDVWHPMNPSFNDCDSAGICVAEATGASTCRKRCDATTDRNTNAACGGNACVPVSLANPKVGYCRDQPNTRTALQSCGGTDPQAPDYGYCLDGLACKAGIVPDVKLCAVGCITTCPLGFSCVIASGAVSGSCLPVRDSTRATGESCEGSDPREPSWNTCAGATAPCIAGVCERARTSTRAAGETCRLYDSADPGYDDCAAGSTCVASHCAPTCMPSADGHGDCADATATCYDPSTKDPLNPGWCLASCDPTLGLVVNATCGPGYHCRRALGVYAPGQCWPLPPPAIGSARLGEDCSKATCDGRLGLYCHRETSRCALVCDPRSATTTCPSGAECAPDVLSSLGGGCRPTATRNQGEACDLESRRCVSGLVCKPAPDGYDRCARVCTVRAATPATNPGCTSGTYCAVEDAIAEGGFCNALPAIPVGVGKLDDRCSATAPCEGAKGLYCESGQCVKACDPRAGVDGNPLCVPATQECAENVAASPKGGGCLVKGSKDTGEQCGMVTNRCLPGNRCAAITSSLSLCEPACDPTQVDSGCSSTRTCRVLAAAQPSVGACFEVPQPTRSEGQSCLGVDPRMVSFNDCATGLACYEPTKTCIPAHARLAACSHSSECTPGTTCTGGRSIGNYYCLDVCTPSDTNPQSTCPAGWVCVQTGSPGNCIQKCAAQTDCSYGTVCDVQSATLSYCL